MNANAHYIIVNIIWLSVPVLNSAQVTRNDVDRWSIEKELKYHVQ